MTRTVLVGVDGSPSSTTALEWALGVAAAYDAEVEVLHAWQWVVPVFDMVVPDNPAPLAALAQRSVDSQLQAAAAAVGDGPSSERVHARAVEGDAASALVARAASADLLALGRHGQLALVRRLLGPTLGSVAGHCLNHSPAPVAIVPDGTVAGPPLHVVVGMDGSAASVRALQWAAEHARAVDAPLVAVLTWQLTTLPAPSSARPGFMPPLADWQSEAEALLRTAVGDALPPERAGQVRQLVLHEPAAAGLLGAVGERDVLVLGDRGRGGFSRLLLGSVSRQCAEHAGCPVIIVPRRDRSASPSTQLDALQASSAAGPGR